jgi:hypothetical protein
VSTFITCGDGRRSIWWWRRRWRNQVEIKNNLVYKQKPITHKYIFMCYMKYTHVVLHNQYMKYVSCIDNRLNMYLNPMVHDSISTEDKNYTREGGEDRKVAVPGQLNPFPLPIGLQQEPYCYKNHTHLWRMWMNNNNNNNNNKINTNLRIQHKDIQSERSVEKKYSAQILD